MRKKPYRYLGSRKYEGMFLVGDQTNPNNPSQQCLGQKEYSGKVINLVDQVARFSEVGTKYNSVAELTSTMADGEENSGVRLVKAPQPNLFDNRSLAIHPASTIFGAFSENMRKSMDVKDTTIRLSVGLEDMDDLFEDIKQAVDSL